jgi:chromatin segregation and condensation protein Rec8/ScpA/Scc1 (kleisin family)
MKKIENQTWYKANAGRFFKKKSRFPSPSRSTKKKPKKRPKWSNLHKVLSAFQRLLERVKSTSENEIKNLKKKSEVFSLPLAMYIPILKAFG